MHIVLHIFTSTDYNDDGIICEEDLNTVIDKMTNGKASQLTKDKIIERVRVIGKIHHD